MKRVQVQVQRDHLERMANGRKPIVALTELVWNALDADASRVEISFEENNLGGLETIRVADDGLGIGYEQALGSFGSLGGSWKKAGHRTPKGRYLHGRAGEGRFCAFALGDRVVWRTCWLKDRKPHEFEISGEISELGVFSITDPAQTKRKPGTEVIVSRVEREYGSLTSERALQQFTEAFALYLRDYRDVQISYDGKNVDPKLIEELVSDYKIPPVTLRDGRSVEASLTIIEWKIPVERALILCDAGGFALNRRSPGIQAPGFDFTVYVKSDFLRELEQKKLLDLGDLEPDLSRVVNAAKTVMRDHFRLRQEQNAAQIVEKWKEQKIYPFEGPPKTVLEEVERKVFDVVALNINSYLPDFNSANAKSKKLSLHMLKHTLEQSPQEVQRLVQEVLDLPKEKQVELTELLERTTLTAIINASKIVADRLDFLAGLEVLVFDPESKEKLLERSQLHRLLAENTWIFGEEFNLTVDDQSLKEVLRKHLRLLGRDADNLGPVRTLDGKEGIVDLMLSRVVPQARSDEREHLVIELKRPSQPVDADVATQIEKYAFAVAEDERFRDTNTRWIFWAVSNEMDDFVRRKTTNQANRPDGILHQAEDKRSTVWVKTWGQIIQSCKARLRFFQERLQYMANSDSGLDHLQKTYDKYLPKHLKSADAPPQSSAAPVVPVTAS